MKTPDNSAEVQLQQELREMFLIDTQQQLETYFDIIQRLTPESWIGDIQSIYRAIHTIKGGAVTVDAESMLQGAMVLEDLLSDLRYLEVAPPLSDRQLSQILLEAGELLASCLEIPNSGGDANIEQGNRVQLTIQRLQTLHVLVKQKYLPDWNELKQVHQEFADQGFDLVILDLEMELANLPDWGKVPTSIVEVARSTIEQLAQIGTDLELASGWMTLIAGCDRLINMADSQLWRTLWLPYFEGLKACVKNSGEISPAEIERLDTLVATATSSTDLASSNLAADRDILANRDESIANVPEDLADLLDDFFLDEEMSATSTESAESTHQAIEIATGADVADTDLPDLLDDFFLNEIIEIDVEEPIEEDLFQYSSLDLIDSVTNFTSAEIDDFAELDQLDELELIALIENGGLTADESVKIDSSSSKATPIKLLGLSIATTPVEVKRVISIPVPLERLDRSAQQVVDTLLTARAVHNGSSRLQSQLSQLNVLTQESSTFVTRLRQLQDDYALLRSLNDDSAERRLRQQDSSTNVTTERYRQGYTTIVRLLENVLRMSELGQEIETATYQNRHNLEDLDRSIMRLKDGIETSRLVPFRNLTLRAKAILRDLTNRYDKPAELIVQNEQVELDAGIVQQLEPALLHLLRNAYDHGLEATPLRLAAGKTALGIISVSLQRRGNIYRLEVEDDGGGINAQEIGEIAKSKGFPIDSTRTNSELLAVLCQPGFSSSNSVSAVSGRGVGMDVVVAQLATIGGKLSLETKIGSGTKFTIEVPAPQLLVPCVLFQVGDRTVAFPTEEVLETALLSSMTAQISADDQVGMCAWTLITERGDVAGFDLANYWQFAQRSLPDTAVCIRTRQGATGGEIWSIADDLLGQSELLINPLPSPLIAPVGLLGVSLQSDGRLISILDPIALTTRLSTSTDRSNDYGFSTLAVAQIEPSAPTILIVDDAALMRRRFEASLNTCGFITHTCNDGLEALNWLQTNPSPDLMITDVEMPNMDGFTLIDRARRSQINIPILVVSSRLSEEWGKEARRLGATDYLNKGFSTPELIEKVNLLLGLLVKI
jgi:chemotaxis protein histidine kinase CheA/CheY-like chemotaxis protein